MVIFMVPLLLPIGQPDPDGHKPGSTASAQAASLPVPPVLPE